MNTKERLEKALLEFIETTLKDQSPGQPEYVQIVPELAQVLVKLLGY